MNETSTKLDTVKREFMLRNAHRLLAKTYKKRVLWSFVSDICGLGSTSACIVCVELGWDPYAETRKPLP